MTACSAGTRSIRLNTATTTAATAAATVATTKDVFAPATSTSLPATEEPTATPSPSAVPIQVNASVTDARGTSTSARVNELMRASDTATCGTRTKRTISQT